MPSPSDSPWVYSHIHTAGSKNFGDHGRYPPRVFVLSWSIVQCITWSTNFEYGCHLFNWVTFLVHVRFSGACLVQCEQEMEAECQSWSWSVGSLGECPELRSTSILHQKFLKSSSRGIRWLYQGLLECLNKPFGCTIGSWVIWSPCQVGDSSLTTPQLKFLRKEWSWIVCDNSVGVPKVCKLLFQ